MVSIHIFERYIFTILANFYMLRTATTYLLDISNYGIFVRPAKSFKSFDGKETIRMRTEAKVNEVYYSCNLANHEFGVGLLYEIGMTTQIATV